MLKVLFDHQTFSLQRYGGISRYIANLHHAIQNRNDIESGISLLYTNNYYLKEDPGILGDTLGRFLLRRQKKIIKWNTKYSKYIIDHNNYDVLHPTYYDPYFLDGLKKPFVITVHDMIHERFPEYFSSGDVSAHHKRRCIEQADHIIAISESTKKDIQHYHQIPSDKITVIHHGAEALTSAGETPSPEYQRYLLYVGDRSGYKNFSTFMLAITPILKEQPDLRLVCAGGGEFQSAENELLFRLKVQEQVIQLRVTDPELAGLYKHAVAFIYPSLYEGFGLPLLEAFKYGCPVIASDTSCFREVGENAISYFDPCHAESMYTVIRRVTESEADRSLLIAFGEQQLSKFAMNTCIDSTIQVYKNLV